MRVWVDSEKYPRDILRGFRHLDFVKREVTEYSGDGWRVLQSNQTCMRFIEVAVMDDGVMKII